GVCRGSPAGGDSVAWRPDGRRLATASADVVSLWSADGTPGACLKGHTSDVLAVAWSPDGARLASASRGQTVRLWSAGGEPEAVLKGHPSARPLPLFQPR